MQCLRPLVLCGWLPASDCPLVMQVANSPNHENSMNGTTSRQIVQIHQVCHSCSHCCNLSTIDTQWMLSCSSVLLNQTREVSKLTGKAAAKQSVTKGNSLHPRATPSAKPKELADHDRIIESKTNALEQQDKKCPPIGFGETTVTNPDFRCKVRSLITLQSADVAVQCKPPHRQRSS